MTTVLASAQRSAAYTSTAHAYVATNAEARRLIAALLSRFQDVCVRTPAETAEPLLVVECEDADRARSLHDIIVTIDWGARLLEPSDVDADRVA